MIQVEDKGRYFRVTYDKLEVTTWPKTFTGFYTAEELGQYLSELTGDRDIQL